MGGKTDLRDMGGGATQKLHLGPSRLEILSWKQRAPAASGLHMPEAWWVAWGWNSESAHHLPVNDLETGEQSR